MKNLIFKLFRSIFILSIFINLSYAQKDEVTVPIGAWPPFTILDESNYSGIDIELWKEFQKRLNLKVNLKVYPWSRSLKNMRVGRTDIIAGIAKRESREEYLKYIERPYYSCSTVFYVQKGNSSKIKKYEDLENRLIGYVDNSAYFLKFDNDKTLNKIALAKEQQLIKMLAIGRLDVIVGTDCQADYDIAKMGYTDELEKAEYRPGNSVDLYFAISKNSEFIKRFDEVSKVINEIVDEGLPQKIAKKYLGK